LLIGETAPRGTGKVVPPLTFLRGVLCLNSKYRAKGKCAKLGADGWAHHPYTTKQGPTFIPPSSNDATLAVLSRLTKALDKTRHYQTVPKRSRRHLRLVAPVELRAMTVIEWSKRGKRFA
jgi:hypothetical protein